MKKIIFPVFLMMILSSSLFGICQPYFYNGKKYAVCDNSTNWFLARTYCQSNSFGDLLVLNDSDEDNFIQSKTGGLAHWIGFDDNATEGSFIWVDGSPVTYTNWNWGEPNNAGIENCATIGGTWNDLPCSVSRPFVCEKVCSGVDTDTDGIANECDNCVDIENPNQEDADFDNQGDVCDTDLDNDGISNDSDNCPNNYNSEQLDNDSDLIGDVCDNCIEISNNDQNDEDNDTIGDVCDNCVFVSNGAQSDMDNDLIGDDCDDDIDGDTIINDDDNCQYIKNLNQDDLNDDGEGDDCDDDIDGDGIENWNDNCPLIENNDQSDSDSDWIGDVCDNCFNTSNPDQKNIDNDEFGDVCDEDIDNDTILNIDDNCELISNENQLDTDEDDFGDVCDNSPNDYNPGQENDDGGFPLLLNFGEYGGEGFLDNQFSDPFAVAVDSMGNIYVADNGLDSIKVFDSRGNYLREIEEIYNMRYFTIDKNDVINVVITSEGTDLVRFDLSGEYIDSFSISSDIYDFKLTEEYVYLLRSNCRVQKYDLEGEEISSWDVTNDQYHDCYALAIDENNNIYASFDRSLAIFDENGMLIENLIDLDVDTIDYLDVYNGQIYILEYESSQMKVFTDTGELKNIISNMFIYNPHFIKVYNGEIFIISDDMFNGGGNGEFRITTRSSPDGGYIIQKYMEGDEIGDASDNCISVPNQDQRDTDEDGFGDACDLNYCSIAQSNGQCPVGKGCDDGICFEVVFTCSITHPDGYCDVEKECVNGVCVDLYYECSSEHTDGYCDTGKICDNGSCVDIVFVCSSTHLDGFCSSGKECVQGVCTDISHQCSVQYPDGYCDAGKICDNGSCVDIALGCSPEHTDGFCPSGKVCDNGECVNVVFACSLNHANGYCEQGKQCVEGNCVDFSVECSTEHIDGYCETGKICENGNCVNIVYACSPTHSDGFCSSGFICKLGSCRNAEKEEDNSGEGCSYSLNGTKNAAQILMLFIMMIGLIIRKKYN